MQIVALMNHSIMREGKFFQYLKYFHIHTLNISIFVAVFYLDYESVVFPFGDDMVEHDDWGDDYDDNYDYDFGDNYDDNIDDDYIMWL